MVLYSLYLWSLGFLEKIKFSKKKINTTKVTLQAFSLNPSLFAEAH